MMRSMWSVAVAVLLLAASATGQWRDWHSIILGGGCGDPNAGPWGVSSATERTGAPGSYRYDPVVYGFCPCDSAGQMAVAVVSFGELRGPVRLSPTFCPNVDPTWGAFVLGTCSYPPPPGSSSSLIEWHLSLPLARSWGGMFAFCQAIVFDGTGILWTTELTRFELPRVDW